MNGTEDVYVRGDPVTTSPLDAVSVIVRAPLVDPVTVNVCATADAEKESDAGVIVSPPPLDVIETVSVTADVGVTVKFADATVAEPDAGPTTL